LNWILAYICVFAVYAILIRQGIKNLSLFTNRVRLLWNIILMNFAFTSIRYIIPILGKNPLDSHLAKIDSWIVGKDLSIWAQQFYSKPLTEVMSIGYMLFIVFLFLTFSLYAFKANLNKLCRFCFGIFTLYAIGISGYSIVPAQGPLVHLAGAYSCNLEGYTFTELNRMMVAFGSSGYDVFPSLHAGVGLFLLLFYREHDRPFYYIYLLPFIILVLSTIYLRYHYLIDVLVGIPLSVFCYYIGEWTFQKFQSTERACDQRCDTSQIITVKEDICT
jgi:membrane-associated phospholipid phosphatase